MRYALCCFLFVILTNNNLFAQEEELIIAPDRPGITFGATTVPKGYLQLEIGVGLDLLDSLDQWTLNTTDLRYGLTNNFELRAGLRGFGMKNWGVPDLALEGALTAGFKWLIVDKKVQLTYLAEAYIPLYPNIINAYHMLGLGHPVGERVSFAYMLLHNYNFSELQIPYPNPTYGGDLQFAYNVNFVLSDKWSFYVEFTGMWDSGDPTKYQVLYDAGVAFLVKNNLQLDLFFGHGLNYKQGTYGIGISWLPLKGKKKATVPSANS